MSIAFDRGKLVFQKTERALLKLTADQEPESVHNFRTSTRRLQTLLEQLLPETDRNQKKLLKTLDRIRKRAGKLRDLDVQLSALRSLKVPLEPRRKTQLAHSLIEARVKHEKRLRKLLIKQDVKDIKKRIKRGIKEIKFERTADPLTVAKQILFSVEHRPGALPEDVLHKYRIAVKRARYAAEFAPKSAESEQFIADLKHCQDAIGNWHDWLSLTHTAADRLGDINRSSLVAALRNVTRGQFRPAVSARSASSAISPSISLRNEAADKHLSPSA